MSDVAATQGSDVSCGCLFMVWLLLGGGPGKQLGQPCLIWLLSRNQMSHVAASEGVRCVILAGRSADDREYNRNNRNILIFMDFRGF